MTKARRDTLSIGEARRIALAAQGLDRPRPRRADIRHVRGVLQRLGVVQLDFVNVLVPAHYMVVFSRLGTYDRARFDELVYERYEFTEQWAHEASIVPVEHWPFLRQRRETHRVRPWGFEKLLGEHADYAAWILENVRSRGPLAASDVPEPDGAPKRISDAWGWGLAVRRQVFEAHFGFGRLAVARRQPNLSRVYDLSERIIPKQYHGRVVSAAEAQRQLILHAARTHGIGTAADIADYHRIRIVEGRARIAELVEEGLLREVRVEGWRDAAYLHPEARLPRRVEARTLLSPFDPTIWCRPRITRLFNFDYRIEIYTPAAKRRWGYYVLPFLMGERLVARVDLKAERTSGRLLVETAHLEEGAPKGDVAEALASELEALGSWLGLERVAVARRGNLAQDLSRAVRM